MRAWKKAQRLVIRPLAPDSRRDLFEDLSAPEQHAYEPGNPIAVERARTVCVERSDGKDFPAAELKRNRKMIGHPFFKQIELREFPTGL